MFLFSHSWPYEMIRKDIYIHECPFCHSDNVLTNLKQSSLERAKEGIKTIVVMPCCHNKITILRADDDYFWAEEELRNK